MKSLSLQIATVLLLPALAWSYILPTRTILQKTSENAGSGIYAIEQDVQFSNGNETLTLKETWLIENDHSMRLTVTSKDLQNSFSLQFVYNGNQRWSLTNGNRKSEKISDDFLERYLNFRTPEALALQLAQVKIIPTYGFQKKPAGRVGADFKYEPESWVRYSRTGGVVNYALGVPTPVDKEVGYPAIWIEQDHFVIRKLRLPSQVEMVANNYTQFSKGLSYPRERTIRWGNNTVTIRLLSASARPVTAGNLFQPTSLDRNIKWDGINNLPAQNVITEFYTRFR